MPSERAWREDWSSAERQASAAIDSVLGSTGLHEGHVVRALARCLAPEATVLVGSSMPIRDADTFWPAALAGQLFLANRGASGIDGFVSTTMGVAAAMPGPVVALVGDLTLYHDMNGLWALRRHRLKATFVVLDNDGGGIFSFLPPAQHPDVFEELFATPLRLPLDRVAALYGLGYGVVEETAELPAALGAALESAAPYLLVVRFRRDASVAGHRACWAAVARALSSSALPAVPGT
jgi:2-succinyl-5-enolpyruvyl-6-hydroxy-3-cyclohexene-1-carboxylate synthase